MQQLGPRHHAVIADAVDLAMRCLDDLRPSLRRQSGNVEVEPKADGTPVTAVDHEVDERLCAAVTQRLQGHGVLSEERETRAPDTEWTWIIDPIDGTSNFTVGLPWWCVSIALAYQGTPVMGLIEAPALGRRYLATDGGGASMNGSPIRVRPTVDWRSARSSHIPVMLTTGTARRARQAGVRLNPRVMGSTALDLATVADGVAVACLAVRPHIWDVAAGLVIVREAGGCVITLAGEPWVPLTPGVDHQQRQVTTTAAADGAYAANLAQAILRQP